MILGFLRMAEIGGVVVWIDVRTCGIDWPEGMLAISAEAIAMDGEVILPSVVGCRCMFLVSNNQYLFVSKIIRIDTN